MLDLTRLLPGPVCTLYLADLGADVVKVEDTGAGDYARNLGNRPGTVSAFFRAVNRNKRSIALDLKDARGRDAFLALARDADVDRRELSARRRRRAGRRLRDGRGDQPAHRLRGDLRLRPDRTARARSPGTTSTTWATPACSTRPARAAARRRCATCRSPTSWAARRPPRSRSSPRSLGAQRTGRGRYVDVAMADASLAHNIFALHALEQWGRVLPRGEDLLTGGVPCYGVYPTQDGRWLAVGALEDKFWQALCATIARPDLVAGQFALGDEGARVRGELERVFAGAPLAAWAAKFAAVDCCVTPIATLDEALADPQFAAREMVLTRSDGSREYAPPFKLSGHRVRA